MRTDGGVDARLGTALDRVARECGGRLSVAVRERGGRRSAGYGTERFATASVVKVQILAALLLQAYDHGRELGGPERERAEAMIRHSDNGAASALWRTIGGEEGLDAAGRRLGLARTEGGAGGFWGLTRTTATDQLTLLRAVYEDGPPAPPVLPRDACAYIRTLMARVVAGQRWGVTAAEGRGQEQHAGRDGRDGREGQRGPVGVAAGVPAPRAGLKNGWMPRDATGLWVVHSVGRVTVRGRAHLLAVLSDGHRTRESGIRAVEEAACAAVAVLG